MQITRGKKWLNPEFSGPGIFKMRKQVLVRFHVMR